MSVQTCRGFRTWKLPQDAQRVDSLRPTSTHNSGGQGAEPLPEREDTSRSSLFKRAAGPPEKIMSGCQPQNLDTPNEAMLLFFQSHCFPHGVLQKKEGRVMLSSILLIVLGIVCLAGVGRL